MTKTRFVPVPRVLDPDGHCRCEQRVIIRQEEDRAGGWYCARCGLPPSDAHRPPAEIDALRDRVRGLATYAELVHELGEPDRVRSGERLREARARVERYAEEHGVTARTLPAAEAVREAGWNIADLSLTAYENADGSVEHHIGIWKAGQRRGS